jgi:hypothetical protein
MKMAPILNYLPKVRGTKSICGHFDGIEKGEEIVGWVLDSANLNERLSVGLYDNDSLVLTFTATDYRSDLNNIGVGDGNYGYKITVPSIFRDGAPKKLSLKLIKGGFLLQSGIKFIGNIKSSVFDKSKLSVDFILGKGEGDNTSIPAFEVVPDQFLSLFGYEGFVYYTYLLALGRPADAEGYRSYTLALKNREVSMQDFWQNLFLSEEASVKRKAGVLNAEEMRLHFQNAVSAYEQKLLERATSRHDLVNGRPE